MPVAPVHDFSRKYEGLKCLAHRSKAYGMKYEVSQIIGIEKCNRDNAYIYI